MIKGRKRLYITDTLCNLIHVTVVAANQHNSKVAKQAFESALLESEMFNNIDLIYADSAFGSTFKKWAAEKQMEVQVPKTYTINSKEGNFLHFSQTMGSRKEWTCYVCSIGSMPGQIMPDV